MSGNNNEKKLPLKRTPGHIRKATEQDAVELSSKLRAADLAEIKAGSGVTPLVALNACRMASEVCFAVCADDGEVIALFGVVVHPVIKDTGFPWMLSSDRIAEVQTQLLRQSKWWMDKFLSQYKMLIAHVDARNKSHISWLRWCGFTFLKQSPNGVEGRPFFQCMKVRAHV